MCQSVAADGWQAQAKDSSLESTQLVQLGNEIIPFGQYFERATIDDVSSRSQLAAMSDAIQQWQA
jgi:hypothetical protein